MSRGPGARQSAGAPASRCSGSTIILHELATNAAKYGASSIPEGSVRVFDATRQAQLDGLVRIGIGRDVAEVAFSMPFDAFKAGVMQVRIAPSGSPQHMGPRAVDASTDEAIASGIIG